MEDAMRCPIGWCDAEAEKAARAAFQVLMETGGFGGLFLYFRRGSLVFAPDAPEGYELGTGERCPIHLEVGQLVAWTIARARRLPCLPVEA
jgi:hypothetical protein